MSQQYVTPDNAKWQRAVTTIFYSGLAAGLLDGIAGLVVYHFWFGFTPVKVFQFVASGIYGKASYTAGTETSVIGALIHFLIGFACAIPYFYAYPKMRVLHTWKITSGLVYGLFVYLFMNLVIMPLSNVAEGPPDVKLTIIRVIWHMLCVGLPIALITAKHYQPNKL